MRIRVLLVVAAIYIAIGIATADLASSAASPNSRQIWRVSAWVISLLTFASHIALEQVRFRNSVKTTATHAAAAVALAVFALAIAGPVRSHWGAPDFWRTAALSVPLWPILAGFGSFVVAFVAGSILKHIPTR